MSLQTLPDEILIDIIRRLDMKTVYNLYNTCTKLRHIITAFGILKNCHMSFNSMASAHIFKWDFFKVISPFVQELNLYHVQNLSKTNLIPAVKKLKCLKSINVGCTNIGLQDFLNIYQCCPTIIDVTIDFIFDKNCKEPVTPKRNILQQCQQMFQNFKRVHFIGSMYNLISCKLAAFMLEKAKDIELKLTVIPLNRVSYTPLDWYENDIISYNTLSVIGLSNCYCNIRDFNLNSEYDCIVIDQLLSSEKVYCTAPFVKFFKEQFNIDASPMEKLTHTMVGELIIFCWKTEKFEINNVFFKNLSKEVSSLLTYRFNSKVNGPVPSSYHLFEITYYEIADNKIEQKDQEILFKRRRVGQKNITLNFDDYFQNKETVRLSIIFRTYRAPVTLTSTCNFLSKLNYLSLEGCVEYSNEFFNVLFRSCCRLETLKFMDTPSPHIKKLVRALPLSKSLRNLELIGKQMDFGTIITFLSQCSNLENVILVDLSLNVSEVHNYEILFEKCKNLYSITLFIAACATVSNKQVSKLKQAKQKSQKHHVYINVQELGTLCKYTFNANPVYNIMNLININLVENNVQSKDRRCLAS